MKGNGYMPEGNFRLLALQYHGLLPSEIKAFDKYFIL